MPGLIWVRDLVAGDVMVDRSFRVERLRPLGLSWAATLAWEPQALRELVGSLGAILELWAVERWSRMRSVDENQIVIAAEVTVDSADFGHLEPIVGAAQSELEAAGVTETPGVLLADAGYWHQVQMENVINHGIQVLIPPDSGKRKAPVRDGMAAPTRTCDECFRPTVVQSFIESAKG